LRTETLLCDGGHPARRRLSSAGLPALRRYLLFSAASHALWEVAHLPLYANWVARTPGQKAFFLAGCIAGDTLIALFSLALALWLLDGRGWPERRYWQIAFGTVAVGLVWTVLLEWLNVHVLSTWGYSNLMPMVPLLEVGASPLLQWVSVPFLAFWLARPR
jgi:hypothetical protein